MPRPGDMQPAKRGVTCSLAMLNPVSKRHPDETNLPVMAITREHQREPVCRLSFDSIRSTRQGVNEMDIAPTKAASFQISTDKLFSIINATTSGKPWTRR